MILPAFGATIQEMQLLDQKGVQIVDTTCPWVSKVWTAVEKHRCVGTMSRRGWGCVWKGWGSQAGGRARDW